MVGDVNILYNYIRYPVSIQKGYHCIIINDWDYEIISYC